MSTVHSHRDLLVWQRAMALSTDVYLAARRMQPADRFVLGTELQRTAVSIPSNIAEGWARNQRRVLAAHVRIAVGSDAELDTQLELAKRVDALRADVATDLLVRSQEVGRMLHGLLRSVEHRLNQQE
jgi:four helix bundle protein